MFQRELESKLEEYLETKKMVVLVGARQVGKTTLLKKYYDLRKDSGEQAFFINLERPKYLGLLNEDPENIFTLIGKGEDKKWVFIDEIQKLDDPSTFLKYLYDEYAGNLKLVVTGSSAFYIDKKFRDSLAGRKHLLKLYSLSFHEFLRFKGKEDVIHYLGKKLPLVVKTEMEQLAYEYMLYGGYPEVVQLDTYDKKEELLQELTTSYMKKDIQDAGLKYEYIYFQLLTILCSQIGELVNYHELANTLNIDQKTIKNYITVMRKSFHMSFVTPFFTNKRKEITKMPKVYCYDTGIRNSILNDFEPVPLRLGDKGGLLENFFFRVLLRVYPLNEISFRRNNNQNEVDFVVGKNAWEIKYNLNKFSMKKYKVFIGTYPTIDLKGLDLGGILEEEVTM